LIHLGNQDSTSFKPFRLAQGRKLQGETNVAKGLTLMDPFKT